MAAGVGVAIGASRKSAIRTDAASYTITFSGSATDSTTISTSTTASSITGSSSYVSGNVAAATKAYGATSSGVKLGTGSAAGSIKINLSSSGQVTPTSIVVNAKRYNPGTAAQIGVNGSTKQALTSSYADYTFAITSAITYLQFDTNKYAWLKSVTVNYTSGTKLSTPTNLAASGSTLSWTNVSNNSGYAYVIDTKPSSSETTGNLNANVTSFDASTLSSLTAGEYTFKIKAKGDGTSYTDSDYTSTVDFTITGGGGSGLQITFNNNGSDSSTALTTANFLGQVTSGSDMISSCTAVSKVYPGNGGLKFGSSGSSGSFTISFAQGLTLNGSTLTANLAKYSSDSGNFVFSSDGFSSDITKEKGSTTFHDVEIGTFTSEPTYLTVSTSATRGYLASLAFETNSDTAVTISTATTTLTYDGSDSQTVTFTATPLNFEGSDIEYEWYSSDDSVLDSTNAGSTATGTFTIVGFDTQNTIDIHVYALSDELEDATSSDIHMTVNREQYSGSLTITTNGNMLTGATGTLAYTLTGNTHTMNTFVATSSNTSAISFSGLNYTAGSTAGATATVTLTASSTQYSLETYTATLNVTILDAKGVVSIALSNNTRTAKFGGQSNSVYVTATLADSTTTQDKEVSWEVDNPAVVSVTENVIDNKVCGTLVPVNVGTTKIRAKLKTDNTIVSGDCTVTVQAPDVKNYSSLEIVKGANAKTTYYDDDTTVDTTDLSLKAIYTNNDYPTYREEVAVAANASGVTWTLDTTNRKVKASYTISSVTQEDNFTIVITERPISLIPADLGVASGSELTGPYTVGELSVTFDKGTNNNNSPKYYSSDFTARLYVGNTITITSSAHVASIDQIELTIAGNYNGFNISVNQGGTSSIDGSTITFTGTTQITFTVTSTGFRFTEMEFSYTKVQPQDKDVESVTVTPSTISLPSGDDTTLEVSVLPLDARDTSVTWSVTNASPSGCVTVDPDGTVHAIAVGSARVVATSTDQPSISDYCTVTVTQGPVVKYEASSSVEDSYAKLGNAYFEIDYSADDKYYSYETARGAQFGSGQHSAGTITFETIDLAFATSNLRVVVNAAHSGDGQDLDLHVSLGNTQIGDATTLTKTATDYEFEYSGSGTSTVDLSNRITISMTNNKGALYIKTIKIYADNYGSNLDNFCSESLRMSTYDQGGTIGSTGGNNSCRTWWNDVNSAYGGLTDGQKYVFCNDNAYSAACSRFSEWARINGYSFNPSTGVVSQNPRVSLINVLNDNTNTVAIIVIISMVSVTAIGGYFFLRKREENI